MAAVEQVLMGYKVGLQLRLGQKLGSRIKELTQRAQESNGSVSFMGFEVAAGGSGSFSSASTSTMEKMKTASDFSSVSIPGEDNCVPVLLGVLGRKLQGYKPS